MMIILTVVVVQLLLRSRCGTIYVLVAMITIVIHHDPLQGVYQYPTIGLVLRSLCFLLLADLVGEADFLFLACFRGSRYFLNWLGCRASDLAIIVCGFDHTFLDLLYLSSE